MLPSYEAQTAVPEQISHFPPVHSASAPTSKRAYRNMAIVQRTEMTPTLLISGMGHIALDRNQRAKSRSLRKRHDDGEFGLNDRYSGYHEIIGLMTLPVQDVRPFHQSKSLFTLLDNFVIGRRRAGRTGVISPAWCVVKTKTKTALSSNTFFKPQFWQPTLGKLYAAQQDNS